MGLLVVLKKTEIFGWLGYFILQLSFEEKCVDQLYNLNEYISIQLLVIWLRIEHAKDVR
jgi:hypothetical protein